MKREEQEGCKRNCQIQESQERQKVLNKQFESMWSGYAHEKRQHKMDRNEYLLNILGDEVKAALQQAEYDRKQRNIVDAVDLFVPLSIHEDELALKMSDKVHLDDSGKFVVQGQLEEVDPDAPYDIAPVPDKQKNAEKLVENLRNALGSNIKNK